MEDSIHLGGTAKSPKDVRRLHALGLQFAEIPIKDPLAFSGQVERYQGLREDLGIYYLCHGPSEGDPKNLSTLEGIYLPKVLALLPLAERLGMTLLTVHLWIDPRFVPTETILFKIDLLGRILERAAQRGITVCLENLSENASHMEGPLAALPDLNLTLDMGHGQLLSEENTSYGFIERHPGRIKHVHLHDNRGGLSPLDDLHLPPGKGIIDFERIFRELEKIDYTRTMTLELTPPEINRSLGRVKALLKGKAVA
jgi:sugar phosphate isomerase/epimerase